MSHSSRQATSADLDAVVSTLTSAFLRDPVWGPVFPDEARRAVQMAELWRVYAGSALRCPWTFVTPGAEAVAVWIPPGGVELTEAEERRRGEVMERVAGAGVARAVEETEASFGAAHPEEPFFHLTILGTHTDHRGKGLGMALLSDTLARLDDIGANAYLESTNPANDRRYESVGFVPRGQLVTPGGQTVTTMWRRAR
ncbi:GNAT family N-acetyltransferase [Streptomyces fuscichromogenes]|uniref:GNAT family N-acetyltransferase n=1 Tax=Streptomyces fuscichromogenes TaxID=1324013 RepID=UPI003815AD04